MTTPAAARARETPEIAPAEALARQRAGALLIDVREEGERASGCLAGAAGVPCAQLAERIGALAPDRAQAVVLICASGQRSLRMLEPLRALGYVNCASVRGGILRWHAEGLPLEPGELGGDAGERYARQLALPEVGVSGQRRLARSCVALVGAGGLGAPAAFYLAAAGVGRLTLIDDDRVERSNLQRQILHTDARVGLRKVESARIALAALNPTVDVRTLTARLGSDNVEALRGHDLVIDGADNFPTRYLLDAACRRLGLPLVYGAVHRFTGQVSVFDPRRSDSPCYRCLFPTPPGAGEAPNCSEAGVLGVLPGVIGMLQATEAMKLLLGIGAPLVGRLLCYDALAASFRSLRLPRAADCPGCGTGRASPA
ncbi:molybdopterin-synthase adenylyltransferase MoeB [Dokdonella sp.]|uniref:molybdopterin-synthase adenylyltransferase MoeB n=1 Tax=Dokdonella sp. TaxID=2291710 RepID=UPI0031C8DBF1|nr:molybdopterin-synthase adenylyltransferase MoeB [Dokdonella sp.]